MVKNDRKLKDFNGKRILLFLWPLLILLAFFCFSLESQADSCTTPTVGMTINSDTTLCSGTYDFSAPIVTEAIGFTADNVTLSCEENTVLDGGSIQPQAIRSDGFDGIAIEGCTLEDFGGGIEVLHGENITVSNNRLIRVGNIGGDPMGGVIRAYQVNQSAILDNYLDNSGVTSGSALTLNGGNDNIISGNEVRNITGAAAANHAIVVGYGVLPTDYNQIIDNTTINIQGHGVLINSNYNTISGNYISDPDITREDFPGFGGPAAGIQIENDLTGNIIEDNIITEVFADGIEVFSAEENDVYSNVIRDNQISNIEENGIGVSLNGPNGDNEISGNTISDVGIYGIALKTGTATDLTLEDNTVTNAQDCGIFLGLLINHITIKNNIISHSGSNGLCLAGARANTLEANTITESADSGISIEESFGGPADENEVNDNIIQDNQINGIKLNAASANNFSGNQITNNGTVAEHTGYFVSLSPLSYNSIEYSTDGIAYFLGDDGLIEVAEDETFITGLVGTENVNVGLITTSDGRLTIYLPADLINSQENLETLLPSIEPTAVINYFEADVFLAQGAGQNYLWQSSLSVASDYTALPTLTYQTVTDYNGSGILVEENSNNNTFQLETLAGNSIGFSINDSQGNSVIDSTIESLGQDVISVGEASNTTIDNTTFSTTDIEDGIINVYYNARILYASIATAVATVANSAGTSLLDSITNSEGYTDYVSLLSYRQNNQGRYENYNPFTATVAYSNQQGSQSFNLTTPDQTVSFYQPTITAVSPTILSSTRIDQITITGQNFTSSATVTIYPTFNSSYNLNNVAVNTGGTQITANIPINLRPGLYTLKVINSTGLYAEYSDNIYIIRRQRLLTAPNTNGSPQINIYDESGEGTLKGTFYAYNQSYRGSFYVTSGDINGDGIYEIITAPGPNFGPQVKVFNQSGTLLYQFMAYADTFRGGVNIASGDIDNDGKDEIVTIPASDGGSQCRIFGLRGNEIRSTTENLWIFSDRRLRGGFSLTMPDFEPDGKAEIVVAPLSMGSAHLQIFGYRENEQRYRAVILGLKVYAENFHGGVTLGKGDINQDGDDEIITGINSHGGPHSFILYHSKEDGQLHKLNTGFYAFHQNFHDGINVTTQDTQEEDGIAEIITAIRAQEKPIIKRFNPQTLQMIKEFYAYPQSFKGGVNVSYLNI